MAQPFEILFLLPFFLLPLSFFLFKVFRSSNITKLPPGPTPWPVIGNIFHMGKMPHITLTNFAKTYGPIMSLKLGTKWLVVGSSPSAAIEILKTHDRILSGRNVPNAVPSKRSDLDKISMGWASECHNEWRYLRTLCRTELFAGKVLESQACLREKKVMELVEFLKSKEGQVVNIGELVFATMLNMLSNVLISKDMINLEKETEDSGIRNLVRGLVEAISAPNISDFYPILGKLDLQGLREKARYVMTEIRSNWESILEERRNNKESGSSRQHDFLEALLDNGFTNDCIHQLFVELLSAGSDTSTSTIEWAMAELIKNVESMKKVQDELEIELSESDYPKESLLLQLSYVQACVKETLRLHPPAPLLLPHSAIETCQVMSYTIPKDAQILVNVWAISRDPLIWEDPEMFRPQRFLSSDMDFKGNDFEFLPFGAGRRICPGLPMAAIKIPLLLASLVHFFDWELPHGKCLAELDMTEKFGVTLQKKEPLLLIPRVRK
ncbi:probable (S)-N-methylcoclaurine 3'-hydroxylase isozyme 2 [Solanum dulcamara]|uniref:probable (S)-N-methylcoclaurine 3'-hydroxylase isozyme 2 n=1 Tax=Solanum dulcamara TaxID=45834 RepID=UPI00248599B5|nr:probable (S)-N-methylcoclaurine 3'-hydroxylase isozyme 2 [Solanum dulcamara]XP_055821447.1 probable (S)-N-methylcoclaurine 3'-hydroxylase isozyme 2 [Solanum dulcamara]XP_055821448.1 probable (S)-N-methylcoclaurine 3'-hydroxylase isozyme 2 [Solanum dulcamara]